MNKKVKRLTRNIVAVLLIAVLLLSVSTGTFAEETDVTETEEFSEDITNTLDNVLVTFT